METTAAALTPQQYIEKTNAEHQVVVWALVACPHCKASKALLAEIQTQEKRQGLDVTVLHVDGGEDMENGGAIKAALIRMTGQRKFPNTFVNGKQIGSNDTLQKFHASGELDKLLDKQYPSKWTIRT